MKYSWHIITVLLAAVVAILSFNTLSEVNKPTETTNPTETILQSIMTRSSVRKYTSEKITKAQVDTILRAGMAAPTAGNRQPWRFYVVRDTAIIKQFDTVTKYAAPMSQAAQLAIVVCGVPSEAFPVEPRYWVQDVSAASENILLAAHAMGLGAVWCGVYPGEERVATLRRLLNIPEHVTPFNIIMMGHPDGEQIVKEKWKPEKVHYIGR